MLDELLDLQLKKRRSRDVGENAGVESKSYVDEFDRAGPYRQFALGIRDLVRLRYLSLKKRVLAEYRQALKFEVYTPEIHDTIHQRIKSRFKSQAIWPVFFSRAFVYLSLLAVICAAIALTHHVINTSQQQALFKNTLPEFADTVYLLKAQQARDAAAGQRSVEELAALQDQIDQKRDSIHQYFAGLPAIQTAIDEVMSGVEAQNTDAQDMIDRAKQFNDLLFERKIPYYISVFSRSAYCADLPTERFFERLFSNAPSTGELCDVHALTAFDLEESRYYADRADSHLALFTRRLDEQELYDSFLGLVHLGDDRAQVRLSNIRNASADSLTAVSGGVLKSKLMPEGMPDVYGLESFARRLQSRVINSYIEDIERKWWARIPSLWREIMGEKPDLLALAGRRLEARIADVTAFHEVQHLVDQAADIKEPDWFDGAVKPFGSRVSDPTMRRHVLWELSAFFTHFAYAEELQGVLLNEFTAIALDPMLQNQPHFYSIRILLPILQRQLNGELDKNVTPASTLAEVAQAYKSLAAESSQLSQLAKDAYRELFGQPLPALHEIRVPPRSMSRHGLSG